MLLPTKFVAPAIVALSAASPKIQLGSTTLYGRDIAGLKQEFYGGIPYAEPPVGSLRLKPTLYKKALDVDEFDASNFGLACLQRDIESQYLSEDCLTINVLRPADVPLNASIPVMAWVHGGGFDQGASSEFNGSSIVAQSQKRGTPVVFVTFNYRLGPLGFPQGREALARGALNLGLKDQLTALQWIQDNIGAFGGDNTKVTLFGESAGAIGIGVLFLSPSIQNFVRAGIFQSGSAGTTISIDTIYRDYDWRNFVRNIPECAHAEASGNTFECLQTQATKESLLASGTLSLQISGEFFPWDPTIDGEDGLFPDLPSRLWKTGHFAHLPFIAGTNLDEGTLLTPPWIKTTEHIRSNVIANFTPSPMGPVALAKAVDKLLELYPNKPDCGSPFSSGNETFGLSSQYKRSAAITADLMFESQRRLWTKTGSGAGQKVWSYQFIDPHTPGPLAGGRLGVGHLAELPYLFGGISEPPSAVKLSEIMIDYWVSFATSLDPNDGNGNTRPEWPLYTPKNEVLLQLHGENITVIPDTYRKEQIEFINSDPAVFTFGKGQREGEYFPPLPLPGMEGAQAVMQE